MQPKAPFILLVDDDEDDRAYVDDVISSIDPNLRLITYKTGEEAFYYLESIPPGQQLPNVIVLDLNMPGWNGIQTLAAIKSKEVYYHVPIYIFTVSEHPMHRQQCLSLGAFDYLVKPYNTEEFINVCHVFAYYRHSRLNYKQEC